MTVNRGRAWTFGDHINSESILLTNANTHATTKFQVLEHYDPEFHKNVQEGDFIVAGRNFGASSGRPAGQVLKKAGVSAVICESAGRVFYRNTWNMALPVLQCPGISSKVQKGDELEVDVEKGTIKIIKTGEVLQALETPWILLEIYHRGGMLGWIRSRRSEYKTLEQ